jgi:WS/DGAT/MGAT family acyltransferase
VQQLSAQDASFIYLETPAAPMHVGSLCIYDGSGITPEQLTEESIARAIDERLHLNPTMRRRLVRVPFEADYPYWIEDADFDLEYHIRRIALPRPGDRATLMKTVARIFARPLDMSKPLWEMYVIEGLENVDHMPANSFAVLTKTHHAAVDGASALHFLEALHDLSPTAEKVTPPERPWRPDPLPSDTELMMRTGLHNLTQPFRFAQTVARQMARQTPRRAAQLRMSSSPATRMPRRVPKTRFNGSVSAHRVIGSIDVTLADIKRIRQAAPGATVNDVVLAICGGGLRSYLESKNELDEHSLVAMAPVNIRGADESTSTGGNRVSALLVPIGTDIEDPLQRLQAIYGHTSTSKSMHSAMNAGSFNEFGKYIPAYTAAMASRFITETAANVAMPPCNVTITNVPGPQEPLYFAGAQLRTGIGIGPISQGMGLIFPVLSYCGTVTISFTSCREILPDPEDFEACLQQSFEGLLAAADPKD